MAGDILVNASDIDAVRHSLGVDSSLVSDTLIDGLLYLQFVEGEVKELITTWSTILSGEDQDSTRLKLGVATWVAARLAGGYMERVDAADYSIADYSQRAIKIDWPKKARELMSESARYLAAITGESVPERIELFTIAGPTRSRSGVPTDFEEWLDQIEPTVIDWLEDEQT